MATNGDIMDYVERSLTPIAAEDFTPVDSLIPSRASYSRILPDLPEVATERGVEVRDPLRAECFPRFFWTVWDPEKCKRLLFAVAASPRFRLIRQCFCVDNIDDAEQKQFAACVYVLSPGLLHVAFRGTNWILVGWKEDFNMTFAAPVPTQKCAADYLATLASRADAKLLVGSHSEGGNLAIYAAARNAELLGDRLLCIYSHDGPGFVPEILTEPGFRVIEERVDRTVPRSSIVGMFLDQSYAHTVVKSTNLGPLQHDPFSWVAEGKDFARTNGLSFDARRIDTVLSSWLLGHSPEQRELLVNAICSITTLPEVETVTDLVEFWRQNIPAVRDRIAALGPKVRAAILGMFKSFTTSGLRGPERKKEQRAYEGLAIARHQGHEEKSYPYASNESWARNRVGRYRVSNAAVKPPRAEARVRGSETRACSVAMCVPRVDMGVCGSEIRACRVVMRVCWAVMRVGRARTRRVEMWVCGVEAWTHGAAVGVCGAKM